MQLLNIKEYPNGNKKDMTLRKSHTSERISEGGGQGTPNHYPKRNNTKPVSMS